MKIFTLVSAVILMALPAGAKDSKEAMSVLQKANDGSSQAAEAPNAAVVEVSETPYLHYKANCSGKDVNISYVGTFHYGAPEYYRKLHDILAKTDIVIAEGVLPSGFYGPPYLSPYYYDRKFDRQSERIRQTKLRLYSINIALKAYKAKHKRYPDSLAELHLLRNLALFDAWGNLFIYTKDFNVISVGAGGKQDDLNCSTCLALKDGIAPPAKTIFDDLEDTDEASYKQLLKVHPNTVSQEGLEENLPGTAQLLLADVSVDMLPIDDIPQVNKSLRLRDKLPGTILKKILQQGRAGPLSVGIHYGAGHAEGVDSKIKQILREASCKNIEVTSEMLKVWPDAPAGMVEGSNKR